MYAPGKMLLSSAMASVARRVIVFVSSLGRIGVELATCAPKRRAAMAQETFPIAGDVGGRYDACVESFPNGLRVRAVI